MSNIIKHVHIEKLFGTTNIDWELNPIVNILVGKNGSGKSTILKIIEGTLSHKSVDELEVMDNCELLFVDGTQSICDEINSLHKNQHEKALNLMNRIDKLKIIYDDSTNKIKIVDELSKNENKGTLDEIYSLQSEIGEILSKLKNSKDIIDDKPLFSFKGNKKTNIEFISTINMSANSINEITTSSGQHTNFLDFEITNEVQRLLSFDNKETLKENLLSALNNLFSETNKSIEFDNNKLIVKLTDGTQIDFNQLSSGERQVIFIFLKVVIASVDGALILMDEPEISLHLSWQEKLLNEIRDINKTSQIIIVTHSPAILMNGWLNSFVDIENIMTEVSTSEEEEQ